MKNANKTITIIHRVFDPQIDADKLTYVTKTASWFGTFGSTNSTNGMVRNDSVIVRIPTTEALAIGEGDHIALGSVSEGNIAQIEKSYPCGLVVAVTDNRDKKEPHYTVVLQ